eukprot:2831622-Ditylum_brightwellii.AAC.1
MPMPPLAMYNIHMTDNFLHWTCFDGTQNFFDYYLKLSMQLNDDNWNNVILLCSNVTTPNLASLSKCLYHGLINTIEGDTLLSYVNSIELHNKSINLLSDLFKIYGNFQDKSEHNLEMDLLSFTQTPDKPLDEFACCLRTYALSLLNWHHN